MKKAILIAAIAIMVGFASFNGTKAEVKTTTATCVCSNWMDSGNGYYIRFCGNPATSVQCWETGQYICGYCPITVTSARCCP